MLMSTEYAFGCIPVNALSCFSGNKHSCIVVQMKTLAERLKIARNYADLTQVQLAELSLVSQQTISKIESGKQESSAEVVNLAVACRVRPEWLAMGVEPMVSEYHIPTDSRIAHAVRIMEALPPEALDYVIKDIDKTADLIDMMSKKDGSNHS